MYFIPKLLTQTKINHYISDLSDGNMSFDYGEREAVIKNRKNFLIKTRIPSERVVNLFVQHGTKIIDATQSLAGTGVFSSETAIKADALVTREKNLALMLLTADCLPIVMFDPNNSVLGLAHVSRLNSVHGFAQTLVTYFTKNYGSNPSNIQVYIGPSIYKSSYKIPEFPDGFDLIGENLKQLQFKGILDDNIFAESPDTVTSKEFFSHYRAVRENESEGRFATVAMQV